MYILYIQMTERSDCTFQTFVLPLHPVLWRHQNFVHPERHRRLFIVYFLEKAEGARLFTRHSYIIK